MVYWSRKKFIRLLHKLNQSYGGWITMVWLSIHYQTVQHYLKKLVVWNSLIQDNLLGCISICETPKERNKFKPLLRVIESGVTIRKQGEKKKRCALRCVPKSQTDVKEGHAMSLVDLERNRALSVAFTWRNAWFGPLLATINKITRNHWKNWPKPVNRKSIVFDYDNSSQPFFFFHFDVSYPAKTSLRHFNIVVV